MYETPSTMSQSRTRSSDSAEYMSEKVHLWTMYKCGDRGLRRVPTAQRTLELVEVKGRAQIKGRANK